MKQYVVRFRTEAIEDMVRAYQWGVDNWGVDAAASWFNDLEARTLQRLTSMPQSCPKAPEDAYFDEEIRHLIFGRYRVLFTIEQDSVSVFSIRGPFVETSNE